MFNQLGADTGFDSIGEFNTAKAMSHFLNKLNMKGKLTRTILYTLNPCANEVIATMLGNFQGGEPGKIQFGSGWWFNDQMDGMIKQMNALSVLGLLSRFVGMLTASSSIDYTTFTNILNVVDTLSIFGRVSIFLMRVVRKNGSLFCISLDFP